MWCFKFELSLLLLFGAAVHGRRELKTSGAKGHHYPTYPPLNVITVATNASHPGLIAFKESLETVSRVERKINLTVVETTHEDFWNIRWRAKIVNVIPVLRTLPPNEVIVLADSNDAVMLPCGRDLVTDFERLDVEILLGSCEFQHPDHFKERLFPNLPVQDPKTPFTEKGERQMYAANRFINAGIIMGRVHALLHHMSGTFMADGYIDNPNLDDQSFWSNMYLRQFQGGEPKRVPILVDTGGVVATMRNDDLSPVAGTGFWKSDKFRYSACIVHSPGGETNAAPLRQHYYDEWKKSWPEK